MSKLRGTIALLTWGAAACDNPEPRVATQSTAVSGAVSTAVSGAALPSGSADPAPLAKTAGLSLRIECECQTGPLPAAPGKSPIRSRRVVVEPTGAVKRSTLYVQGPPLEDTSTLEPASLSALNALAREVFVAKSDGGAPEQPVPDGTMCALRLSAGASALTFQSPHPSTRPLVAPLVEALVKLLAPL